MKTLLITGAAGAVGRMLRPELAGRYRLRLSDVNPVTGLSRDERFTRADVTRLADMKRITRGVDAILHLGGFSVEGPWQDILEANIIGCYNLFEAARLNGVKRILFATSNHACGFYRRDEVIDHTVYPKPDSRYGVSKVFGEQLGSLYADKYGMQVLCLRIGNVATGPVDKRRLSIWVSPRDLAQLVGIGVDHPDIHFEIVYGVSGNQRSWYDNRNAARLGYKPQDDSEPFAAEVLAKEQPGDPMDERYQGGTFVRAEIGGDPSRKPPKTKARRAAPRAAAPAAKPAAKAGRKTAAASGRPARKAAATSMRKAVATPPRKARTATPKTATTTAPRKVRTATSRTATIAASREAAGTARRKPASPSVRKAPAAPARATRRSGR